MDKNGNNKGSLNNKRKYMIIAIRFSLCCMLFVSLLLTTVSRASADLIIDNGNQGTSYTGIWAVSKGTMPYGANSLSARNGATFTWKFTSQPSGTYEVFIWWSGHSNRGTNIPVKISSKDGIKTVYINQQLNAGKWNSLGKYNFNSGGSVMIIAPKGYVESTCADAIKITPLALNTPPKAYIDSITPNPALSGTYIQFTGFGTDAEGSVTAYLWESSINGPLSSAQSFSAPLSSGIHTITLTVYDNNGAPSLPVSQTLVIAQPKFESNLQLAGFPHQIDIYSTSIADKAVVFLHGGGGSKYKFAANLGFATLTDNPITVMSIDWEWLNRNKIVAVFPQGQALPIAPAAFTWDNHVMESGQDDTVFLQAVAGYIKSQYGISDIFLVGHSNGGMMVNRVWCEATETFNAYISLAGPASSYYLAPSTPCSPSSVRPYYGIIGGQDDQLQVAGNWEQPTWELNPQITYSPAFINTMLIGEWNQQVLVRAPLMCNEVPSLADGATAGDVETWSNCNGKLKLQKVLNGNHDITSLEMALGQKMRDVVMSFINQL